MEVSGVAVRLTKGWSLGEHYRAVGRNYNGVGKNHMKSALLERTGVGHYRARNSYLLAGSTNWTTASRGNRELNVLCVIAPNVSATTRMMIRRPFEDAFSHGVPYGDARNQYAQSKA